MGWKILLVGPLLSGPIVDALSRTLFHFLWEGALIALALAVSIHVFRPSSASLRYGLACAAMLAMVAAFVATLGWCWPHSAAVTILSSAPRLRVPSPVPFTWPETARAREASRVNWIVAAWLLGACLFSMRGLMGWIAAMRLKRSGVCAADEIWRNTLERLSVRIRLSRAVTLLESCLTDVPIVVGFLRPAILIPAALFTGFPPDQLEFILIHELAHIRRGDYLVNLFQSIVENALFYHPAVWWVSSVMRAERENCCDDIVVAETHNAHGFAAALVALEQSRWTAHEAALAVNGGNLMNRVRRLLEGRERPHFAVAQALFAGLLPVLFAIVASASHAQSAAAAFPFPVPPAPRPPVLVAQARPVPVPQPAEAPAAAQPESPYTKWLNEEAVYIISDGERKAFRQLTTDAEREMFIEQFWLRRDPTPATPENELREEHYRRIAYANENFASDIPGWKTDRGMIYIKYGPPDEREEHRAGGAYKRPAEEGGGETVTFPFERWRYRYIEGVGKDVIMEFVDTKMNDEYHMTMDPAEKDALRYVPGAGLTPVTPPEGASIEDIVFRGTRRVAQDVLRNTIRTKPGDKFDKDALDRDFRALWNTQRFADIRVTYEPGQTGWIVVFTVVEIPPPPRN
jgi:GWxTD domain-containing protein